MGTEVEQGGGATRIGRWLSLGALVLAIAYFAWRGVLRGISDGADLAVGYSAALAWLAGHDPYDPAVLGRYLLDAGGVELATTGLTDRLLNVYFPGSLLAFVPLAWAGWTVAKLVFLAVDVAASVFIAVGLGRVAGWRPVEPRALLLIAFVLALSPVQTTVSSGQTAVVSTAALVAGLLVERSDRQVWSGALHGLATVLKVQIGLSFLAYLIWRRMWAAGATAALVVIAATLIAIARMSVDGVPWMTSWPSNLIALSGSGGMNDPSQLNPVRYSLINLHVLAYQFVPSAIWSNVLTYGLVGLAAGAFLWLVKGRDQGGLLALSLVAVLTLLVTYHRYYDAVLLAFPIAWALSAWPTRDRLPAALTLLLCADFILPMQTAIYNFEQDGVVPEWVSQNPLWTDVVEVQHIWALILLAVVLLWAAARARRTASLPTTTSPGVTGAVRTG